MTLVMRGLGRRPCIGSQVATYDPRISAAYAQVLEPDVDLVAPEDIAPSDGVAAVLEPRATSGVPDVELAPLPAVGVELKPDPYSAGEE